MLIDGSKAVEAVSKATTLEQAIDILKQANDTPRGIYECFHCGTLGVVWQADFDFEDFGLDGEGIVQVCRCANCGADIEYYVSFEEEEMQ